ncbi:MAG: DUF4191 family protein [Dermatophilaceae bacterium]
MAKDSTATPAAPKKKPGRIAQMRDVFRQSKAVDPKIGWWMLLAFVVVLAVVVGVGWLLEYPVYAAFLGLPLALLAATIVMSRRAERAAYRQIEGKPGAAGAALTALRGGWFTSQEPVAVEAARGGDMSESGLVFRAVGRPGVVLVAEGPEARARRVLAAERKKVARVAPDVPIIALRVGTGDGADVVPVRKLASKIQRLRPALTKAEVAAVNKRLRALGGMRPPLPQGIDPNRVRLDRKAMRGH